MGPSSQSLLITLLPLAIVLIPLILINYFLAKEKGKNVLLWTLLSIIPIVNYFILFYLIGTPDLIISNKLDKLIKEVEELKSK